MTALERLTEHNPEKAPLDTSAPVMPEWARSREGWKGTIRIGLLRGWYRTKRFVVMLPKLLLLLICYSPRGLGRLTRSLARWIYDMDSAEVRHAHAERTETSDYVKAHNARRANLHARLLVALTVLTVVVGPILCWYAPWYLGGLVGFGVFVAVVKMIPGKSPWEFVVAAGLGVAAGLLLPQYVFPLVPQPPAWVWPILAVVVVLALGWHGRRLGTPLVADAGNVAPGAIEKPNREMVLDALTASVKGITDKHRDAFRVHQPGVARARHGYYLSLELPPGFTVSDVMESREEFAAALRRQLGAVWPGRGGMHPGHLRLFIGDEPMATAEQSAWPLAECKPVDVFTALDLFTDQEGRWFAQRLVYNALVIGGAPGYGKSFALRSLGVAIALDPRARLVILDGKGNGDMRPFRLVAHGYHEGDEPEEIADQLRAVQELREEMRRRSRFLRDLPASENPEDKVTSDLADRYGHLAPTFLLVDECQVYTENPDKKIREAFIEALADIVRRGRSAGIVPIFATQKPSADVIPTAITDNCSVRLCFKVNGQRANDAVLGNEMHSSGIKATKFGPDDKGLAWLKGDGAEPIVVRTVHGLDKPKAEEMLLKARALREARGLLTGYAAGEEAEREEAQADLLADARDVMDHPPVKAMHLTTMLEALHLLRPGIWGHLGDAEALGDALRTAGVNVRRQLKVGGRNTSGVRREDLDVAATSDEDPDDEGGQVVPIGR
ncbi:FtsK/SpoIIIE domain-containing protein [Pseudonocardia sp. NPDC049154]|uniref:FtsK/SpoIIIE domain-containing protein n=1 Tax=Pseudonocardia sp. NPDC049154 TaxID=3155501 RepID=UPI0033E99D7E